MAADPNENPFSTLVEATSEDDSASKSNTKSSENLLCTKMNDLIEKIFRFTIRKNTKRKMIFMEDIVALSPNELLNLDILDQALFERLLLPNPRDYLVPNNQEDDEETSIVVESRVISYLYRAFEVCEKSRNINDSVTTEACDRIRGLILRNASTSMKQPDLYEGQSLSNQWLEILKNFENDGELKEEFLAATAKEMYTDDELTSMGCLKAIFYPMFNDIQKALRNANMITQENWIIPVLGFFTRNKNVPQLGELLIDYTTPNPGTEGKQFAETLLGQLLSLSILPKNQNGPYEFFENALQGITSTLIDSLWGYLSRQQGYLFAIFKGLLVLSPTVKDKTLTWISKCLKANVQRGQIWSSHNASLGSFTTASDAFMIGLCGVLLRLCGPLCRPNFKVLLVDPTYAAVRDEEMVSKSVHLKLNDETCLLPIEEGELRQTAETYNFVTELFFMTHKAIDLGYRVCIEKFSRMSREILRLQTAYQDAIAQVGEAQSPVAQNILQMLQSQMQQFLCLRNCVIEPTNDEYLLKFYEASALWLTQINGQSNDDLKAFEETKCYAPKTRKNFALPLPALVPHYLKSIPEFILENIVGYLTFIRHFERQAIELDFEAQHAIFRMILIFMGSVERARNPHLRARMAEGLEALLPKEETSGSRSIFKTPIFDAHEDRLQIVPNLLHVFVSIEMTGQSVQFEQKFNYRRPMYSIMEFLWNREEQRNCFKLLAIEAEREIDAVNPPIFLRFVNLLINDAIFLLDESLSNLQQIRQLQAANDNGEWNNLPPTERQQNLANLQHLGMMARFDNILGKDTINILKLITSEIKAIFCHSSMVDRVASMLNYFLLNLVGPKKGNFKVKDKKELDFDPANTVMEICRIYVNLMDSDQFCLAIVLDGRSYSADLFKYAEQVLIRIGGGQLIGEINELAEKVSRLEKQHKEEQEALADAPDEYLDPIMSTLMLDPVILPSSRVTVDRTTIARHLLSDQTDPFNRSPLTMDQVLPNTELKEAIERWMGQKRKEYNERN